MDATEELATDVGTAAACRAMGLSRATVYRQRSRLSTSSEERCKRRQPRALLDGERQEVLDVLHSKRFVDKAPAVVYAALLDQGTYLCSIRTMYRIRTTHMRSASVAINCGIRTTRSPNCWRPDRIRSGRGTLPSCWGRPNGPTTTST